MNGKRVAARTGRVVTPPRPPPFLAASVTSASIHAFLRDLLCALLRVLLRPPFLRDLYPSAPPP